MFLYPSPLTGSNIYTTSGAVIQPTISYDNLTNKITVGAGIYRTYPDNTEFKGRIVEFSIGETVLDALPNSKYYICVSYNNNNPIMYLEPSVENTNDSNVLVIFTIFTEVDDIDILDWGTEGVGLCNRLNERLIDTDRFARVYGLELSTSNTIITSSGGEVYAGSNKLALEECVSSIDECELLVKNGSGGWDVTDVTVYPNTQYDTYGSGLATLTDGEYGVVWVFRSMGTAKELYIIMGGDSYASATLAKTAQVPSDLPERLTLGGLLLGRAIFLKESNDADVESAFDTVFSASAPTVHNSLLGLSGGTAGQYYHLTQAKYNSLTNNNITGATKTKVTYNADGLVTSGIDATTADINDSVNRRYSTDTEKTNYNKLISVLTNYTSATLYSTAIDVHTQTIAQGFVKLVLTLASENLSGQFTYDVANKRLIYNGTDTKHFYFNGTATVQDGTVNNTVINFKAYKNGNIPFENSLSIAKLTSATDYKSINSATGFTLAPNEYIEIFASVDKNCSFSTNAFQIQMFEDVGYSYNN